MKKVLMILVGILMISLLVVGVVYAFTMERVDGQWSCIEPQEDGTCGSANSDNWATGPAGGSTNYDDPTVIWPVHVDQSNYDTGVPTYTDWNQVRYGGAESFGAQSGFGFDGVEDIYEGDDGVLTAGEAFLLGKWCHFNNPITIAGIDLLEYVDLEVRIEGISCPVGATINESVLQVAYRFTLDETPNSAVPCKYPEADNSNGCADGVFLGAEPLTSTFVCTYDPVTITEYKVVILGSIPLVNPLASCPSTPEGNLAFEYYSAEQQDNCSCLYAQILEVTGTAVELNAFSAAFTEAGVELAWETASEVDNLGFNLYRSSSPIGMKEKLNESIIPSKVIGSTSGASYAYLDEGFLTADKLYYWLESIDLSGSSEFYGPVEVFSFK